MFRKDYNNKKAEKVVRAPNNNQKSHIFRNKTQNKLHKISLYRDQFQGKQP